MVNIGQVDLNVIEESLLRLGGGNHADNMKRLSRFQCHCYVLLSEKEFLGLIFLQNDEVTPIAPRGHDRKLQTVAERAIRLGQPTLSPNWKLSENLDLMRKKLETGSIFGETLTICEARDGEEAHGPWYLQDGSHRALAYATLVLLHEETYSERTAYCSMSQPMYLRSLALPGNL